MHNNPEQSSENQSNQNGTEWDQLKEVPFGRKPEGDSAESHPAKAKTEAETEVNAIAAPAGDIALPVEALTGESPADTRESQKMTAEQRLETIQARLERIEQDLHAEYDNKASLEEEIVACEAAIEDNLDQHDQLSDKADQLQLEIKSTKRNIISSFANGLKLMKNLALGRHDEARQLLGDISSNIDKNEAAMQGHEETQAALDANEEEKLTLDNAYADAKDQHSASISKISRLERQKATALKQIEMLKEEVANNAWAEAWKDAQEGIKAEMGFDNMVTFRNELASQEEELSDNLQSDLEELDAYRNPSRIQRMMRSEAELQRDAERADAIQSKLEEEYDDAMSAISAKREKVDQYFPTWQERVKSISQNNLVSGALSTLKRKILMRLQGIA